MKTRFSNFLLGSARTTELTLATCVEFIHNNCQQSLNNIPLYRGFDGASDFFLLDPSAQKRMSLSGNEFMLAFTSNAPEWSRFPKRNRSAFFSNARDEASSFADSGTAGRVFLIDDAELGICPLDDFNQVNHWTFGSETFDNFALLQRLDLIMDICVEDKSDDVIYMSDYTEIEQLFSECDKNLDKLKAAGAIAPTYQRFINYVLSVGSIRKAFTNITDPTDNGFRTTNVKTTIHADNNELWSSAKYVLVDEKREDEVLAALEEYSK